MEQSKRLLVRIGDNSREVVVSSNEEEQREFLRMSKPHPWGNWLASNLPVSPLYAPGGVHWGLTLIGALDACTS